MQTSQYLNTCPWQVNLLPHKLIFSLVAQIDILKFRGGGCVYAPTSMHRKYRCLGSQGRWPWLRPLPASGLAITGWNMSVGGFRQQTLPGMWCQMCHTESPVDGACSVTSLHASYSGGIKAVGPPSRGVLLPLCVTENISTPPASWASL